MHAYMIHMMYLYLELALLLALSRFTESCALDFKLIVAAAQRVSKLHGRCLHQNHLLGKRELPTVLDRVCIGSRCDTRHCERIGRHSVDFYVFPCGDIVART